MTSKTKEGIYRIRLKNPALGYPSGTMLYIGRGVDVKDRLAQELGKKKKPATFFRSIGLLLGEDVLPKSGKPGTGYNFKFRNPERIIEWLVENTTNEIEYCEWRMEEKKQIQLHRPLLNMDHNMGHCHPQLKALREKAHEIAKKEDDCQK